MKSLQVKLYTEDRDICQSALGPRGGLTTRPLSLSRVDRSQQCDENMVMKISLPAPSMEYL